NVPDIAHSTVAPCFATCPAGDLAFSVVVRDFANNPIAGSSVVLDFSACPAVNLCSNQEPGTFVGSNRAQRATDSTGTAVFRLRAGGLCPGSSVQIFADGVFLASRSVASADQNGDLAVTLTDESIASPKVGGHDPGADLDCDGNVTANDMSIIDS